MKYYDNENKFSDTGKKLIYQISINPSLLGGVRIRIGNEEYDWTFAARIRQLKDAVGQI